MEGTSPIDAAKRNIAQRALEMGFRFDIGEIIDIIEGDKVIVFLRSRKATRQIEQPDGTYAEEEFNDPLIWLNYPPPDLIKRTVDYQRQSIMYSIPQPQLCILCPELVKMLPLSI